MCMLCVEMGGGVREECECVCCVWRGGMREQCECGEGKFETVGELLIRVRVCVGGGGPWGWGWGIVYMFPYTLSSQEFPSASQTNILQTSGRL